MVLEWRTGVPVVLAFVLLSFAYSVLGRTEIPVNLPILNGHCDAGLDRLDDIPHPRNCTDTCIASGDPHVKTFDCVKFEYHGKCSYTLVKNCADDVENFEIIGEFKRMRYHKQLSIIKRLLITCDGTDILLNSHFGVFINGVAMTATSQMVSYATIYRYCNAVVVAMNNGITIYWSSPNRALIKITNPRVDAMLTGKLCGLCGNNNNIKYDDFTTPDNELVSDAVALGDSWRTDIDCDECDDCKPTICQNNPQNYQLAQDKCSIFIDGTMPACGNIDAQSLYIQCVNILCATLPEDIRFCQLVNIYIETCVEYNVEIRLHGVCRDGCHKNQLFIPYGHTWTNLDCSEQCTCDERNGLTCTNIKCDDNASCIVDMTGSGSCVCNAPIYTGDGFNCTEVNPCIPNPCYNGGLCTSSPDLLSFECTCVNGYTGPRCMTPPPCNSNPCQNGGTCVNEGTNYRCICPFAAWAGPTCNIRCYVCWACGDPHYLSFDRKYYNFQGKCMYTLAKSTPDFQNQFEVVGNNIEAYWNTRVSITREVYVFLDFGNDGWWAFCFRYGYGGILVNEAAVSLPYTNTDANGVVRVEIKQAGHYTLLTTNFGLYVGWNGVHCVFIVVPEFFKDKVQGLCGLFNQDRGDDWTKPDGQLATSPNDFGNSWVYEAIAVCPADSVCTSETCDEGNGDCDDNPERSQTADVLCMFLDVTSNTGPFAVCFDDIDPAPYFSNCKYDICAGQELSSICDDMASYALDCRAAGVSIPGNWRDNVPACAVECGEGMEYNECGSSCPATCSDPDAPTRCFEECVAGCHCKEGLLWTPDGCVSEDQCGCTQNGIYYAPNDEFVTDDCSQKCRCEMGGNILCESYGPCGANAVCTVRYGKRGCYCQNGYSGDGFQCIRWYTCRACGDVHYKTLDGKYYDFQGKCQYTLITTLSDDVPYIGVIANNTAWRWNPQMSITQQLFITIYGLDIQIGYNAPVRVNGEVVNLPYYFEGRKVSIYRACIYTFVKTDFGLVLKWDGYTCVTIYLPSTFMEHVAGLCGFFNGDRTDDFQDPQFNLISNINDFGNSWKYGSDENCDCTPETCPDGNPCDANPGASDVCLPITDANGPFAPCIDIVDPTPYFKDCSYDACSAEDDSEIVCEHLQRYADVCRGAGVAINGWRNIFSKCAIDCGKGMRYTDCGKPCQATCADQNPDNGRCGTRTCVQGCECLPGLVLSGDECVEPSQCGCQYNGRYYMPMYRFVTADCALRCLCVGRDQVECEPFGCGDNAVCDVQDGVRGCYCKPGFMLLSDGKTCDPTSTCTPNPCLNGGQCTETADMKSYTCSCPYGQWTGPNCNIRCYQCYACGDPHYRTFDGTYHHFQGRCSYTLTKSLTGAPNDFEVVGKNVGLGYRPISVTREVYVFLNQQGVPYDFTFQGRTLRVNGLATNLPFYVYNDDGTVFISVETIGYRIVLKTDFGLIVDWNGGSCVKIYLSEAYRTFANGLCGLFNGDRSDDFTGPGLNLLPNVNEFGNSWVSGECTNPCTPTTCAADPCKDNPQAAMTADMVCQPLDADNGFSVFAKCFNEVSPAEVFGNCQFDMCIDPNRDDILCEHFNLYGTACRNAGVDIGNWRASIKSCAIECGENMEYQYCGTACPATCATTDQLVCAAVCVEGCQCVKGFVLENDRCIRQEECGCTDKGRYYQVGETVISDDCTSECVCKQEGAFACTQLRGCSENEVCQIQNGIRQCYCPVGFFKGDGVCQPMKTCKACGDPHYKTFDGKRYDYQGTCSYILAKSGPNAPDEFLVVGDNIPWARYPRATATRYVHMFVYGQTVQFSWDTSNVLVNGEIVTLPYSFGDGKLVVYSVCRYKVLVTDFGLQVIWDGYWCVFIKVPANFVNHVDGLCGHLSLDWRDDFTNPEGDIETNINTFGDSWAYGEECEPCTLETCPVDHPCDLDPDAAAVADDACSPLKDTTGPFAACLDVVDPADYLFDCRFDICAVPTDQENKCSYLQEYASACQNAGVNVNGWRNDVPLCGIECGEFMTYSDCGSGCPATCANPSPKEGDCPIACVQGCQCLPGLVASGNTCVAQEDCGCSSNGRYYMNGEKFVDELCELECICRGGNLECNRTSCDVNAVCEIQNGVRGCYCSGTYIGDGYSCTTPCEQSPSPCQNGAHCVLANNADGYICQCPDGFSGPNCEQDLLLCYASGDPHYSDYTRRKFDFQGDCEYVLTQNCSSDIAGFQVVVDNQKSRPESRVSRTRTVTVMVYGQTIFLGRSRVVQINNGGVATLPFYDSNYSVYLSGYWVVLETDFGLVVEWSGYSTVRVKVPSSFRGNLCGLCGNGNGDGMMSPNGMQETNIKVWGHSWATNQAVCDICEDCLTDEDPCDTVHRRISAAANEKCAIITAKTGVFQPVTTEPEVEPVEEVPQRPVEARRKRFMTAMKRSMGDTVIMKHHVSTTLGEASSSFTSMDTDAKSKHIIHKRQTRDAQAQSLHIRWSASGVREGEPDPFTVNATVGFSDTTPQIQGTGLWKLSMYGSQNSDGTGEQFQRNEQILSATQQAQPYLVGTNLTFVDAEGGQLDITALGCDKEFRFLCFDFARGINPSIEFTFTSFQRADPTKITVCSDRCTEQQAPPPVLVIGLEVRILTARLQADVPDAFVANTTVHFASNSPDVAGDGLWKLSIYGSMTSDGTGEHFQRIEQVLTESQQSQSLEGAKDIFFLESPGALDIHAIGCGEYQYICIDLAKGESPNPDFEFETKQQPANHKYTLCIQRVCEEDMGVDITNGFVLVADLGAKIRIAPLDTLQFQDIPLTNLGAPVAVDFDPVDQILYWTDVLKKTISRSYLDGSGQEVVLSLGNTSVTDGLAIDVIHRQMYWTDTGTDTIERANLDGSARHIIIDMVSQEPRAIIVDPTNDRMYWTDWGEAPKIESANIDGTDRVVLVDIDLVWPNGLAIDFKAERMYWCDAGSNKIESSNLDGSQRTVLLNTGATDIHPFDIGVYGDTILFSDWNFQKLITMNISIPNQAQLKGSNVFVRAGGLHIQYGGCSQGDDFFVSEGHTAVHPDDPCLQCSCLNKELSCVAMACRQVVLLPGQECTTYNVPGECCPITECRQTHGVNDCTDEAGNVIPHGEMIGDACSPCECNLGHLACYAINCAVGPPPLGQNCTLLTEPGRCCPMWSCQPGQGPFVNCHDVIDPAEYFDDCTYDWCATESIEQLCDDIGAYAEACQMRGVEIGHWRDAVGCARECPTNSHYELCPSACQPTCANFIAENEPCKTLCREGCVCDDGYIFEGDACVLAAACGCVDDNNAYHKQGAVVISDDCSQSCVCEGPQNYPETNGWVCEDLTCGPNEECVDGGCQCQKGFVEHRGDCHAGCQWGTDYIPSSETRFTDNACSTGCTCSAEGKLDCENIGCHASASCMFDDDTNLFMCQCPKGVNGDGVNNCEGSCPLNWVSYDEFCYFKYLGDPLTYFEARAACREKKSELTSVHSAAEQSFLTNFARPEINDQYIWIGLTDVNDEGLWEWDDGSTFDPQYNGEYSNWASGQPDDAFNEDCAHMRYGVEAGLWNDISCDNPIAKGYICKMRIPEPCNTQLGMEDGRIRDNQITASTEHATVSAARNARLNLIGDYPSTRAGAWSALYNDLNQWIQVYLGSSYRISGIITQGRSSGDNFNQYVTKYKVQYSDDGENWKYIKDGNNQNAEFNGNSDQDTQITNMFNAPVQANFVRIQPTEWNEHISMRFELLGCAAVDV